MSKVEKLLDHFQLSESQLTRSLGHATAGNADFGDIYLQTSSSETWTRENGDIKAAAFDRSHGFGLRVVTGERTAFAHSSRTDEASLDKASSMVRGAVSTGYTALSTLISRPETVSRYASTDSVSTVDSDIKVALLQRLESMARAFDSRVDQVFTTLKGTHEDVLIVRSDGRMNADIRPMAMLGLTVVVQSGGRRERANGTIGGRRTYASFDDAALTALVEEVVSCAIVNLDAQSFTGGEMTVVVGPGWPGVLLHEAVGHGLEADETRRGASVFSNRIGERVAAPGVTVVDDGTINDTRGSLSIDDEGNLSQRNVLIEDGFLRGYMQDELNARLMRTVPTGNGRRQSYAHLPKPRMTTTYMTGGDLHAEEIIASVNKGLYVADMVGGQVDTTSGNFVFSTARAYLIENGKLTRPVKGATIIGNGPKAISNITMIGNDFALDPGKGVCGKAGQTVPVGVGQPTLRIEGLTVGGGA